MYRIEETARIGDILLSSRLCVSFVGGKEGEKDFVEKYYVVTVRNMVSHDSISFRHYSNSDREQLRYEKLLDAFQGFLFGVMDGKYSGNAKSVLQMSFDEMKSLFHEIESEIVHSRIKN